MGFLEKNVEIANPQHPHCASILLVDTSGSMADKMSEVNSGLQLFHDEVMADDLARKRVECAIVTFDSNVSISQPFAPASEFAPPMLGASGSTAMGAAVLFGIRALEERKQEYKVRGIDYYRPWIILITDGAPTDMSPGDETWAEVVRRVHSGEKSKEFLFFGVGVADADMETLRQICPPDRPPLHMRDGRFRDFFLWFSRSQSRVSASKVGDQVPLEDPTGPKGWAEISTT